MLCTSLRARARRDQSTSKKPLEAPRGIQIRRSSNKMILAVVMASVLGTLWAWIVWIVVGGFAGALTDRLIQGDKLGILGNIVIGIIGGLIGGALARSTRRLRSLLVHTGRLLCRRRMMSCWRRSAFSATSSDFPLVRSASVPSSNEVFSGLVQCKKPCWSR